MERMNLEQLARLVDEQPTPEEQRILDGDPGLRRELEALKAQAWSLGNLPALLPPPGGWHQLEKALSTAGLIHGQSRAAVWRKWLQVAAALVVFIGGTAIGWAAASESGAQAAMGDGVAGEASFAMPASIDEAASLVTRKEWEFRQAMEAYRHWQAQAGSQAGQNPATRLHFLDALVAAIQVAVEENPVDPFFNSFLVESIAERDQVWRQISQDNWN